MALVLTPHYKIDKWLICATTRQIARVRRVALHQRQQACSVDCKQRRHAGPNNRARSVTHDDCKTLCR